MSGRYRFFFFDFDTAEMGRLLNSETKGYSIVRRWFKKNDVTHIQGSGYKSKNPLTADDALAMVRKLGAENPWLATTVKSFVVTSGGKKDYDFSDDVRDAAAAAVKESVAGANDAESAAASAQKAAEDQKAVPADEFVKIVERENENVNE